MKTGRMLWGRYLTLAVAACLALVLAGCNTGDTGPAGPAGPPGQTTVVGSSAKSLTLKITGVTIGQQTTVNFTAADQNGVPYAGVPQGDIEVTIAELIPGTDGDADHWQNYINQERKSVYANAPMSEAPQPQAISGSDGILVNHQDGSYTFTFGGQGSPYDVTNITTPVKVSYDPSLTQRVALTLRPPHGSDPTSPLANTNNAIYTWQPSTGATSGINEKKMVSTATCDSCHGELDLHGGPRHNVQMCVTCHNAGNTDPNTGQSLAFNVMIHKIHDASNLPKGNFPIPSTPGATTCTDPQTGNSVACYSEFVVYGYMNSISNFTDVVFPQNIENCTRCHVPETVDVPNAPWTSVADYQTQYPDWDRYETRPTMATCGSCHSNIDFAQGKAGGHPGGVETDNSECTVCHSENSVAGSVTQSHEKAISVQTELRAKNYEFKIVKIADASTNTVGTVNPGDKVAVTYEVLNPNTNQPYDLTQAAAFDPANSAALNIDIGWNTVTPSSQTSSGTYTTVAWTNLDAHAGTESSNTGSVTSQPLHFSALKNSPTFQDNGNGTYTVTSPTVIPPTTVGFGVVGLEGYAAADINGDGTYAHDERIPVTSAAKGFAITAAVPVDSSGNQVLPPDDFANIKKCQVCHGRNDGLAMHGGNRNDNLHVCVICHNPHETDLSMRLSDPDQTANGVNSATADGLEQRSIDFKLMIHAIHGAAKRGSDHYVVYGYGNSVNDFSDVLFPNPTLSCNICHTGDSYAPPVPSDALPTTVASGATVNQSGPYGASSYYGRTTGSDGLAAAFDPSDDYVDTPTAAVCSACHTSTQAKQHMVTNGAELTDVSQLINGATPITQSDAANAVETCSVCHGSGRAEDVAKVHDVH